MASDSLYEQCPWLDPGYEMPAEDQEERRELAERDWLTWYGETLLPAASNTTEGLGLASAVGRGLAFEDWEPTELTQLWAERIYKDLP